MNKLKKLAIVTFSLAFLTGWGGTGHNKINYNTTLYFPKEMSEFTSWNTILAQHASDADNRKYGPNADPTEGPKHYIDIENYAGFLSTGKINESSSSAITSYGVLPWATITTVDSLKSAFQRRDWTKAQLFAADLGHYVGDGHMPLHLTKDYNGRTADDKGIHTPRYDSEVINRFQQQITFFSDSAKYISNVSRFVFDYIYENYKFVDSFYYADGIARSKDPYFGNVYYDALWNNSSAIVVKLFNNASKRLASLIYTAWVDAGKPEIYPTSVEAKDAVVKDFELMQNYPNPFNPETVIKYRLNTPGHVRLSLYNLLGKEVAVLFDGEKPSGEFSLRVNAQSLNIESGVYFYRLSGPSPAMYQVRKMTLLK